MGLMNSNALGAGVGLAGSGSTQDQFLTLIAEWNQARFLSKPAPVRAMMLLRQRGQGGTFDTEDAARAARYAAASVLDPSTFDLKIDVDQAGFNAFETLTIRSRQPFVENTPPPDLAHPPAPAPDLLSSGPQPFDEWVMDLSEAAPNGVGAKYKPLPTDQFPVGETWSGLAKRTVAPGVYVKTFSLPYGHILYYWLRVA